MKKNYLLLLTLLSAAMPAGAQDYTTSGDGTSYSLETLSEIAGSGVTKDGTTYTMLSNVTIAEGDKFAIEDEATLKLGNDVQLRIEGEADLDALTGVVVTRNSETDEPKGIYIDSGQETVKVTNIDFEYCGLRGFITGTMEIDGCSFSHDTGAQSSAGALALATSGSSYRITNCTFTENDGAAIGGGANIACGVYIDNCQFTDNNTSNSNKPQINLTVGGDLDVTIKNSTFTGNKRDKVGAIAVANLLGIAGSNNVLIENCEMRDHRYGITTNGALNAVIKDNRIISNKYESNAMNGGSGISIYDSNQNQTAVITGNHIEDNLWGITIIGGLNINCGKTEDMTADDYNPGGNVFVNNGNGGQLFDLYNNGTSTVYAQGNKWNVTEQTAEEIEKVITHKADNAALGEVIYMPPMADGGIGTIAQGQSAYFDRTGNCIMAPSVVDGTAVEIYTLNGAHIGRYTVSGGVANLTGLQKGIYIARINTGDKLIVLKCAL